MFEPACEGGLASVGHMFRIRIMPQNLPELRVHIAQQVGIWVVKNKCCNTA
jgi:hypothetical protein